VAVFFSEHSVRSGWERTQEP